MQQKMPGKGESEDPLHGVLNSLTVTVIVAKVVEGNDEAAELLWHLSEKHRDAFLPVVSVLYTFNIVGISLVNFFKTRCAGDCGYFIRLTGDTHASIMHAGVN